MEGAAGVAMVVKVGADYTGNTDQKDSTLEQAEGANFGALKAEEEVGRNCQVEAAEEEDTDTAAELAAEAFDSLLAEDYIAVVRKVQTQKLENWDWDSFGNNSAAEAANTNSSS